MKRITEEELQITIAKHSLWLNDAGGEQANFTDKDLSGFDLSHQSLANAIFIRANLNDCIMKEGTYTFCDFTESQMNNVKAIGAVFDESKFKGASIENAYLMNSFFYHCDFSDASLKESKLNFSKLNNSNLNNTDLTDANVLQTAMDNVTFDDKSETEEFLELK